MGIIISRFRKKKNTKDLLEDIETKITKIEKFQKSTEQQFHRVVGKLVVSSVLVYMGALVLYYYYFSPDTFRENIVKFLPLIVFPIAIVVIRKSLTWYYKRKLRKNESTLKTLKTDKKKILEEVMDKETYKIAKEILEKYAPEQLLGKDTRSVALSPIAPKAIMPAPSQNGARQRLALNTEFQPSVAYQPVPNISNQLQPRLPLPRPVLPRNRSAFDRLVDMIIGDGPNNRYAVICKVCCSHNGMALKHEFEYLAFRCAYCLKWNPARKQKPHAPNLLSDSGSQDEGDLASDVDSSKSLESTAEETKDQENEDSKDVPENDDTAEDGSTVDSIAPLISTEGTSIIEDRTESDETPKSFSMSELKGILNEISSSSMSSIPSTANVKDE